MHVLVVSQYFWPEDFRINDLVTELVHRGHRVTVLTGLPNYPDGAVYPAFRQSPEQFARFGEADVIRVPMLARARGSLRLVLNYASFALCGSLVGAWRVRNVAADVVFCFQPSPVTSCLPALVCGRMAKAPVVLWVLDLWPETLAAIGVVRARPALAAVGALVRFIYRRCTLVLGQSRAFAANIDHYAGQPSRFRYFPSWAEAMFSGESSEVSAAPEVAEIGGSGFNILFAGNIGEAQDFPTILAAAARLRDRPDIRWIIVGDGRAASFVREEIARLGLASSVFLLGRFPVARMPEFFSAADALLVTLRRDPVFAMTIPGKLQAYLASGMPVLAALDGEAARVINEAEAGFVAASGDADELARIARRLADLSPEERGSLGRNARAYAHKEFDRATLVSQLERLMEEAICLQDASR